MIGGVLVVILSAGAFLVLRPAGESARTNAAFSDFLHDVQDGRVRHITQTQDVLQFERLDGSRFETIAPQGYVASNPTFVGDLAERGIKFDVKAGEDPRAGSFGAMAFGLVLLGFAGLVLFRAVTGRVPTLEKARTIDPQLVNVTFADVAGVDEAKDEVQEIVDFLKDPQRFESIGGRIPRGILLVGPPGTGKTLLARSMAGEAGVPFMSVSGSDFVEMYAGVGASRVRKLFKEARRHKSCIIFIDELDAVGRNRGGNSLSHEEREQTLNQLLVEMDGFESNEGVILIAATNRPDVLDPALLRPGRFDRRVIVARPDVKGREGILQVHTKRIPLAEDVDITVLARGTPGFSGADLANLVNEAALNAARYNQKSVTMADFEGAKDKVLMGVERKSLIISDAEKRNTAYHEAGHALVAALLPHADPLHKVTIIPRGMALGVTQQLPEGDRHNYSQEYLLGQIAILMGGRIAEDTFLGSITTGASNDIERATELARAMVCEYGMSEMGPLTFGKKEEQIFLGREIAQHRDFSEDTAIKIDQEVKKIITFQYDRAKGIIEENRDTMVRLAEVLLERESLDGVEIRRIVAGLPLDDNTSLPDGGDDERPQLKEPSSKPLKPILPPITGGNPAPA
jgi:cell division protease FtsH